MSTPSKVRDVHTLSSDPFSSSSDDVEAPKHDEVHVAKTSDSSKADQDKGLCKSILKRYRWLIGGFVLCTIAAIAASAAQATHTRNSKPTSFDLLDPSSWLPSLLEHLDYNPYGGDSPYDFALWNAGRLCRGLDVYIVDNLEDRWKPYLTTSVNDWENGSPDALTINVREISTYDPECASVRNVVKVCNGDYGKTDWVGQNSAIVIGGFISSSVAQMNDFHLNYMSDGEKQWTMCHELGHAWGLGHWDERFYNRDLGNCMDYSARPEKNQKPDVTNFKFLEQMYGNVDGTSQWSDPSVSEETEKLHCTSSELNERRFLTDLNSISDEDFARYVKHVPSNPIVNKDRSSNVHPMAHLGWRYVSKNKYREVHELEIEDGVKIVTTVHLARQDV
jgi:hypothetical protein